MPTTDCPHCGGSLTYKTIFTKTPIRKLKNNKGFESVQPLKTSFLGSFWQQIVKGQSPNLIKRKKNGNKQVVIEQWSQDKKSLKIHDLHEKIDIEICHQLANMIIGENINWTRHNIAKWTDLSLDAVSNYLVPEFKRLGYISVSGNNKTEITHAGLTFLRGILRM